MNQCLKTIIVLKNYGQNVQQFKNKWMTYISVPKVIFLQTAEFSG